jgi:polyisoprenoid-binding protein YceI
MRLVLVAALALAAAPVLAQQAPSGPPGAPDPSRAVAGTYKVDTGHTQVLFTYLHLGFTEYTGQFTQPTGSLVLDPKNPANDKVEISFPIDKVATTVPDVTKPITLEARFVGAGPGMGGKTYVGFAATATLNRSDYHLGFLVPKVADKVDLVINAGFVQQ